LSCVVALPELFQTFHQRRSCAPTPYVRRGGLDTPKRGSRLNMVEISIGVLKRQCLHRRIYDASTLRAEFAAWQHRHNVIDRSIDWQFTTGDARIQLHFRRINYHYSKSSMNRKPFTNVRESPYPSLASTVSTPSPTAIPVV